MVPGWRWGTSAVFCWAAMAPEDPHCPPPSVCPSRCARLRCAHSSRDGQENAGGRVARTKGEAACPAPVGDSRSRWTAGGREQAPTAAACLSARFWELLVGVLKHAAASQSFLGGRWCLGVKVIAHEGVSEFRQDCPDQRQSPSNRHQARQTVRSSRGSAHTGRPVGGLPV